MNKKLQLLFLPVICLLLGIALAGVYNLTAPVIAELERKTAEEARKEVLESADEFTQVEKEFDGELGIDSCYKANNGAGVTFMMTTKGYGGDISLMAGVDKEGKVSGVKILTHSETAGLGAKTSNPEFLQQYNEKQGELNVVKNNPSKDNDIVAVTGATTSSKAVTNAINNALTAYEQIKGEL